MRSGGREKRSHEELDVSSMIMNSMRLSLLYALG